MKLSKLGFWRNMGLAAILCFGVSGLQGCEDTGPPRSDRSSGSSSNSRSIITLEEPRSGQPRSYDGPDYQQRALPGSGGGSSSGTGMGKGRIEPPPPGY